ncbi:glycerate kinase [Escherichia coli]
MITGEGRIDSQTAGGKAPLGVASVAKQFNVSVIGIAGVLGDGVEWYTSTALTRYSAFCHVCTFSRSARQR